MADTDKAICKTTRRKFREVLADYERMSAENKRLKTQHKQDQKTIKKLMPKVKRKKQSSREGLCPECDSVWDSKHNRCTNTQCALGARRYQ